MKTAKKNKKIMLQYAKPNKKASANRIVTSKDIINSKKFATVRYLGRFEWIIRRKMDSDQKYTPDIRAI